MYLDFFGLREKLGATEFLGYETESAEGVVTALLRDGKEAAELKKGDAGAVIVNQTPFYGESGGQVGDTGVMTADGVRFRVTDTQKKAGDLFVLCSDGLTNHVEDHEIAKAVTQETDLQEACERLVDLANGRGGEDNTTIIVARCEAD